MDYLSTAFCLNCGCNRTFWKFTIQAKTEVNGRKFSFVECHAVCAECGEELYVPEVNDENVRARKDAYQKAAGLLSDGTRKEAVFCD